MKRKKIMWGIAIHMLGTGSMSLMAQTNQAHAPVNTLQHIDHVCDHTKDVLQVGICTMYFVDKPLIHQLPTSLSTAQEHVFFIPGGSVEKNDVLHALQKSSLGLYNITVSSEKKPSEGLKITLSYDPEKISFDYHAFNTWEEQKGVTFRFYNKQLTERIARKERALLRVS